MSKFALRYPFFIIMLCMIVAVVGTVTVARMPVDLFPEIKIPVVVVATFYNGMPPEQIEARRLPLLWWSIQRAWSRSETSHWVWKLPTLSR